MSRRRAAASGGFSTPPSIVVAPFLTGYANQGQVVTCSAGTWNGAITVAYQWTLDGSPIIGQTASTYTPVVGDKTHSLGCTVTATNPAGSTPVSSSNTLGVSGVPFIIDSFTDTPGTTIEAHVGELGAAWTKNPNTPWASGEYVITNTGRLRRSGTSSGVFYASGAPAAADYDVDYDLVAMSNLASDTLGAAARQLTGADTLVEFFYQDAPNEFVFRSRVAATQTTLGSPFVNTLSLGVPHHVKVTLRSTAVKAYIDNVLHYSATLPSGLTAAGVIGIYGGGTSANSDAAGFQIDNFVASNV
jgi:hypothetical protein